MKTLIIFVGLPGVGKTTLCKLLKKEIKCYFFNSDGYAKKSPIFKKVNFSNPKEMQKARLKFYDTKIKEVERLLKKHNIIVMDAVFDREKLRKKFYQMIKSIKGKLIIIQVVAPEKIIKNRILKDKSKTRPGASPASRLKAYKIIKKGWEPIKRNFHTIHSDKDIKKQLILILKKSQNNLATTKQFK